MHLVNEIWIITDSGLTIYNQMVEEKIDKDLFGGFIAAIHSFIKAMGEELCKSITMGNSQIVIMLDKINSLYFVGRSDVKVKEKKIEEYLSKIMEKFCTCYEDELKDFRGNVDTFKDVDKLINIKEDSSNFFGINIDKSISKSVLEKL
ncbi:MAG: hypothetical protein ACFFCM_10380 [Promethearchaeota archaeon]